MAEKYRKVSSPQPNPPMLPNEVRITKEGPRKSYISYAIAKLNGETITSQSIDQTTNKPTNAPNTPCDSVLLRAMGSTTGKAVTIAEIIKKRIPNLHQHTKIGATALHDVYEPLEEGLRSVKITRHVASIEILLTKNKEDASPDSPGYQSPIPVELVQPQNKGLVHRSIHQTFVNRKQKGNHQSINQQIHSQPIAPLSQPSVTNPSIPLISPSSQQPVRHTVRPITDPSLTGQPLMTIRQVDTITPINQSTAGSPTANQSSPQSRQQSRGGARGARGSGRGRAAPATPQ